MFSTDRLQPYSLPDTGYRGIPNTFRSVHLFATGLRSSVRRVPHFHHQGIITFGSQSRSYVERERSESSGMASNFNTIHPYICFPIDSTEMQQNSFAFPSRWHVETPLINHFLLLIHSLSYSGQGGFYRKGNKNLSFKIGWYSSTFINNCIIPQAIQVLPIITLHNWSWILR